MANNVYSPCLSIHKNLDTFILSKFRVTHSGRKTARAIYETVLRNLEESNKVKLIFGEPKDGWLPTKLTSDEFQLEFNASRIPENPIGSLCESLILVMNGVESECEWNLEPEKYIFGFKQNGSRFVLSIFKKEKLTERIWECTGGFDSIILPLYRGLKNLNSINFGSNDWDQIDQAVLTKLDNLIIDRKTKTA